MPDDNVFDLFGDGFPDDDELGGSESDENEGEDRSDPGVVAFMDQQTTEFNALEHEFADTYGFVHKCKCDQDYSSGNMVEVTECYAGMTVEALEACATLVAENKLLRTLIQQAIGGQIASKLAEADDGPEAD